MFALLAVTVTSCREDADLADPGKAGNPEKEVVGTYTGTWTVSWTDANVDYVEEYPGTVTISAGENAYTVVVNAVCPDRTTDLTGSANVVKQSPDYKYFNDIAGNPFGTAFSGIVTPQGSATCEFKITQRSGRKSYVFTYKFNGTK